MVEVRYDPTILSTLALLTEFFTLHDATIDRGGETGGGQYRSAIFYRPNTNNNIITETARKAIYALERSGLKISTQVRAIDAFYPAENRHQQYCSTHGMTPKKRDSQFIREILTPS